MKSARFNRKRFILMQTKNPYRFNSFYLIGSAGRILSSPTANTKTGIDQLECPKCALTFEKFLDIGKFGCASCYDTFRGQLPNVLGKLHSGHSTHVGKMPVSFNELYAVKRKIEEVRTKMQEAVEEERFEEAAALRDEANMLQDHWRTEVKKAMSIEKFIENAKTGWMDAHGEHSDIVMATRVRLARNLTGYCFPIASKEDEALAVDKMVVGALLDHESGEDYSYSRMADLSSLERGVLVEKHLVSPQLVNPDQHGAVLLSSDEAISVMINEEDHIRIQCIYPGLQLDEAFKQADTVDNILEKELPYAFDEEFGYLTSCPSNTGTGMRASVMMHLPALTITKQIERVIPAISRLGMVVRGSYGEGSKALGNVYQVSNQVTLGKTEVEIMDISQILHPD